MTRPLHNVLTAALATPEEGVQRPDRANPTSAITQMAALRIGDSWTRTEQIPADIAVGKFTENSAKMRDELRNSVHSSLRFAKQKTGGTYTTETGDFISSARNIYLVCVVTRVA